MKAILILFVGLLGLAAASASKTTTVKLTAERTGSNVAVKDKIYSGRKCMVYVRAFKSHYHKIRQVRIAIATLKQKIAIMKKQVQSHTKTVLSRQSRVWSYWRKVKKCHLRTKIIREERRDCKNNNKWLRGLINIACTKKRCKGNKNVKEFAKRGIKSTKTAAVPRKCVRWAKRCRTIKKRVHKIVRHCRRTCGRKCTFKKVYRIVFKKVLRRKYKNNRARRTRKARLAHIRRTCNIKCRVACQKKNCKCNRRKNCRSCKRKCTKFFLKNSTHHLKRCHSKRVCRQVKVWVQVRRCKHSCKKSCKKVHHSYTRSKRICRRFKKACPPKKTRCQTLKQRCFTKKAHLRKVYCYAYRKTCNRCQRRCRKIVTVRKIRFVGKSKGYITRAIRVVRRRCTKLCKSKSPCKVSCYRMVRKFKGTKGKMFTRVVRYCKRACKKTVRVSKNVEEKVKKTTKAPKKTTKAPKKTTKAPKKTEKPRKKKPCMKSCTIFKKCTKVRRCRSACFRKGKSVAHCKIFCRPSHYCRTYRRCKSICKKEKQIVVNNCNCVSKCRSCTKVNKAKKGSAKSKKLTLRCRVCAKKCGKKTTKEEKKIKKKKLSNCQRTHRHLHKVAIKCLAKTKESSVCPSQRAAFKALRKHIDKKYWKISLIKPVKVQP